MFSSTLSVGVRTNEVKGCSLHGVPLTQGATGDASAALTSLLCYFAELRSAHSAELVVR